LTFNEYPVMGVVALMAGVALVLLLNMLGGSAGESPLKRAAPASSLEVARSPSVQAEIAQERRATRRARQRAAARRARARVAAAATAPVAAPRSTEEYRYQPYLGPGAQPPEQQPATPSPQPRADPAPGPESGGADRPGSFDDSG
jgi:hypothetical protein